MGDWPGGFFDAGLNFGEVLLSREPAFFRRWAWLVLDTLLKQDLSYASGVARLLVLPARCKK